MNWYKKSQLNEFSHQDKENMFGDNKVNVHTISIPSGNIRILENSPWADNRNSVVEFVVNEDQRGQGIGKNLVNELLNHYRGKKLSAQVSSMASLSIFYKVGFRPISNISATYEETVNMFKENWGSLMLVKDN